MTDSIEYGQLKTGKRNEAVTLSVRPMLDKIAGALSNGIVASWSSPPEWSQRHRRRHDRREHPHVQDLRLLPAARRIVASLVVFLLTVKIDENMHAHIVEQLEGRLASEEADKQ